MKPINLLLIIASFSLNFVGCSNKEKEHDLISESAVKSEKMFEDGIYTYNSRFIKNEEPCASDDGACLNLNDYKYFCENIESITNGVENYLINFTNQRFAKLYEGGNIDEISGKWIGKESWKSDSGINGACLVSIKVTGILDGTSAREDYDGYAKTFMVSKGKILLHRFSSGSAYML